MLAKEHCFFTDIRTNSDEIGLRDYEVTLLRVVQAMMIHTDIDINETGTRVRVRPGTIAGGEVHLDCRCSRGVGYFLPFIILMGSYGRELLSATILGATVGPKDPSVDSLRVVLLPALERYGLQVRLTVTRRGFLPDSGGEAELTVQPLDERKPVHFQNAGKFTRVRGAAYSARMTGSFVSHVTMAARNAIDEILKFEDVYIYQDAASKARSAPGPGYALCLIGETENRCYTSIDVVAPPQSDPDDVGREAAELLAKSMIRDHGGCVEPRFAPWIVLLMATGPRSVHTLHLGSFLNVKTIGMLNCIKEVFGARFSVKQSRDRHHLACRGVGLINTNLFHT